MGGGRTLQQVLMPSYRDELNVQSSRLGKSPFGLIAGSALSVSPSCLGIVATILLNTGLRFPAIISARNPTRSQSAPTFAPVSIANQHVASNSRGGILPNDADPLHDRVRRPVELTSRWTSGTGPSPHRR